MTTTIETTTAREVARAEPIGSLLRSPELMAGMRKMFADSHTGARPLIAANAADRIAEFNRLADGIVADAVQRQIDAGMDVVTDGELRRSSFVNSFFDAVEGLSEPAGAERYPDENGNLVEVPFSQPVFADRLRKAYTPAADEATFLRALTDHPFKVTVPSPSNFLADFVNVEGSPYATNAAFVEDAVPILRQVVADAVAAGARCIQFDFPLYPALTAESVSPMGSMIEAARAQGETKDTLLDKAIAADAAVVRGIPEDVTVALHLCRGNLVGGFWSGSLAPIAERIFHELPYDRFLFEWEDIERDGGYEQIRFVPKDKIMAMGLVSTKTADLEDEDDLVRRIEAAAQHLDLSQLAITPQCGFASMSWDNPDHSEQIQWRKLDLVGRVADRVWGRGS